MVNKETSSARSGGFLALVIIVGFLTVAILTQTTFARRSKPKEVLIARTVLKKGNDSLEPVVTEEVPTQETSQEFVVAEGSTQRMDFSLADLSEKELYMHERDVFDVSAEIAREVNE